MTKAKQFYEKHGETTRRKFLYLSFKKQYVKYLDNIYSLNNLTGSLLTPSFIGQIIGGIKLTLAGLWNAGITLILMALGPIVAAGQCIHDAHQNHKTLQKYIQNEVNTEQ